MNSFTNIFCVRRLLICILSFLFVFVFLSRPATPGSFDKENAVSQQTHKEAKNSRNISGSKENTLENELELFRKGRMKSWEAYKRDIEDKWEQYYVSTKKEWVDYGPQKDIRSKVDFEKGILIIETIVNEGDRVSENKVEEKIKGQLKRILSKKDLGEQAILQNQVSDSKGKVVTQESIKKFVEDEVVLRIKKAPAPYYSKDGTKRRKFSVQVKMVPEHIRIRAEKYLPIVRKNASRFNLNPQLVLAIIHTESYFNPLAVSSCDAIGIMQIIPKYAGIEVFKKIFKDEKEPSREYLFNPKNNIVVGCAYLNLLHFEHFRDVNEKVKNRYVTICGYNAGPTSIRNRVLKKYPVSQMSASQLYNVLRKKTPKETQQYIERVVKRMPIYDPYFKI